MTDCILLIQWRTEGHIPVRLIQKGDKAEDKNNSLWIITGLHPKSNNLLFNLKLGSLYFSIQINTKRKQAEQFWFEG